MLFSYVTTLICIDHGNIYFICVYQWPKVDKIFFFFAIMENLEPYLDIPRGFDFRCSYAKSSIFVFFKKSIFSPLELVITSHKKCTFFASEDKKPVLVANRALSMFEKTLLITNELQSTCYKTISLILKKGKK